MGATLYKLRGSAMTYCSRTCSAPNWGTIRPQFQLLSTPGLRGPKRGGSRPDRAPLWEKKIRISVDSDLPNFTPPSLNSCITYKPSWVSRERSLPAVAAPRLLRVTRFPSTTPVGSMMLRRPARASRASSELPSAHARNNSIANYFNRFDSSRTPGRGPLNVQIGVGQVIKGKLFFLCFVWGRTCLSP